MALRRALIWLVMVDSETIRPPHTAAIRSSLLTTWLRFRTRYISRSKTCGPTATGFGPAGELPPVRIEQVIVECESHAGPP